MNKIEEEEHNKVFDLARPILENYVTYNQCAFLLNKHLDAFNVLHTTFCKVDENVFKPKNRIISVQTAHLDSLRVLTEQFETKHKGIIDECERLRGRHTEAYECYTECVRKLERFKISNDAKKGPVSNSETQRVVLMVTRMQEAKAALALASTECSEQLSALHERHENLYTHFITEFRKTRELLMRRSAEHLHLELRSL